LNDDAGRQPARLDGCTVVLPAHNEQGNVARAVSSVLVAATQWATQVEVVVVDDGSSDGTAAEAAAAGARVVRHSVNRGYGAALRSGFNEARQPWIWLVDADNQFEARELARLVAHAGEADLVIGYRASRAEGWRRAAATGAWRTLAQAALGRLARDVDCAFKLMRTDVVRAFDLRCDGAALSAELLARARRKGLVIVEVPVTHLPRTVGVPTGLRPRVVVDALAELWRLRAELAASGGRPLRSVSPPR